MINVTRLVVSTVGRMVLTLVTAMASSTLACVSPTAYVALASKFSSISKKQSLVCLSSTEAELYAAVEATKDIIFCRAILAELGFHQRHPTTLYVDNTSLLTLASKYSGNAKTRQDFLCPSQFHYRTS
jgi:hypothetical protein